MSDEQTKEDEVINILTVEEFQNMTEGFGEGMDISVNEIAPKQVRYAAVLLCEHLDSLQLVTNAPRELVLKMFTQISMGIENDMAQTEENKEDKESPIILTH